jgi:nicotinamide-nucleotide amidase
MPPRNERQAFVPQGGRAVYNPNGTAPGIELDVPRPSGGASRLIALPGVPAEIEEMWRDSVGQSLRRLAGERIILHRRIKCFGLGESLVAERLADFIHKSENPRVGITASQTAISLRLAATGASEAECSTLLEPVIATIRERLGRLVFGEDDDELEHSVVRLLRRRGKTLATVEYGTAGMIAESLAGIAGMGDVYRGGIVLPPGRGLAGESFGPETPADDAREEMRLRSLAVGCRTFFGADLGLVCGEFPAVEPTGAATAEPGQVAFVLASDGGVREKRVPFVGHPAYLKRYCANLALDMVRLALEEE